MKILVTGGAGFIGTNLIIRLVNEGHSVISIDNYSTGDKKNHVNGVSYLNSDLREGIDIDSVDVVYHMASLARIGPSFESPKETIDSNFRSTLEVLEFCKKTSTPMVYAGSSSHHNGKFKNPYTFSKDLCEEVIKLYQEQYGLKSTITRFYNVYGPNQIKNGKYCTLIGRWESKIEQGLPLEIFGDGNKRRDFTHVDDIIDALLLILDKNAWGYTFELGRGINYSINEIASMFGKDIVYLSNKTGEADRTLCDSSLANLILGWNPKKNIEDYIKNYLNSNEDCGYNVDK